MQHLEAARSAWRTVRRHGRQTAFIVVTLALGVAAVASALSVADDAIGDAVPFEDAEELVWVGQSTARSEDAGLSLPRLDLLSRESRSFASVAGHTRRILQLTNDGVSRELEAAGVTADFFTVLRIRPVRGRLFERTDDSRSAAPVAVVSYAFWRDALQSREDLSAQSLRIDGRSYTVIGVVPPEFEYPAASIEVWVPIRHVVGEFEDVTNASVAWGIGRLSPGTTPVAAEAEVKRLAAIADADDAIDPTRPFVTSLRTHLTRDLQPRISLLVAAAFLILGLAAASVANLLVGRFLSGRKDIAIMGALGEPDGLRRTRFLLETTIYATGGLLGGLLLARVALIATERAVPSGTPEFSEVALSGGAFIAAVSVSAVLAVLLPLALLARVRPERLQHLIRAGSGTSDESVASRRARDLLLAAEVAATVVLLVSATALIGAYLDLARLDLGFSPSGVVATRVSRPITVLTPETRPGVIDFFGRARVAIDAAPGVEAVALSTDVPSSGNRMHSALTRPGVWDSTDVGVVAVTPEFFATLRIAMRRGRSFDERDERSAADGAEASAVIDEAAAVRLFGGEDPIGAMIELRGLALTARVVGVAARVRQQRPGEPARPQVYLPYNALALPWATVLVRSAMSPDAVGAIVERTVRSIDPSQAIGTPRDLVAIVADRLDRSLVYALLLTTAAAIALLLTATGLYGVVNMRVTARLRELAIRAALGASARDQVALVLIRTMAVAASGVLVGLLALAAGDPVLTRVLYGVSPMRVDIIAAGVIGVLLVVLLASIGPAWRAASVNPATALRAE